MTRRTDDEFGDSARCARCKPSQIDRSSAASSPSSLLLLHRLLCLSLQLQVALLLLLSEEFFLRLLDGRERARKAGLDGRCVMPREGRYGERVTRRRS